MNGHLATSRAPTVSICIPTLDGVKYLASAIETAASQTYDDIEILVVDGGSTDDTTAVAKSHCDPRMRVVTTETPLGMVANWNRAVRLSRGRFVKFLFQDDLLAPTYVERALRLFEKHEAVGLVFSPRKLIVEEPYSDSARDWTSRYSSVHDGLEPLDEMNEGRLLVRRHMAAGFETNQVGEPSCVMIRRVWFERLGLFNLQMHQLVDIEMWLRVLYHADAGFIRDPLATFRVHPDAATARNSRTGTGWLDRLWLVEGMLQTPDLDPKDESALRRLRSGLFKGVARMEASRVRRGMPPSALVDYQAALAYLAFRVGAARKRRVALHGSTSSVGIAPED